MPASNVLLTVEYNANGGYGAPSSQTKSLYSSTFPVNVFVSLSTKTPTRSGFDFLGWSLSSSASSASYSAGDTYVATFTEAGTRTTTMFAVWGVSKSTITADSGEIGETGTGADPVVITINRANASYTHTLTYSFGSTSGTIVSKTSNTSVSWTPPASLASQIPNANKGTCTITCTTYNGNTSLGKTTATCTLFCMSNIRVKVGTVTLAEAVSGLNAKFGAYVQGKSKIKFTIGTDTSGARGASLSSAVTTVNGQTFSGTSFTTGAINASGTVNYNIKFTDTRGKTDTKSGSFSVLSYSSPSSKITSLSRGTATSSVIVAYKWAISSVNSHNDKTIKIYCKANTSSSWGAAKTTITPTGYSGTATYTITGLSSSTAYDVRVDVTDYFDTVSAKSSIASTGNRFFHASSTDNTIAFHGDNPNDGDDHFFDKHVVFHNNLTSKAASGQTGVYAQRSDTGSRVGMIVDSTGLITGLYSFTDYKWIIYKAANGETYLQTKLHAPSAALAAAPVIASHASAMGTVTSKDLSSDKTIATGTNTAVVSIGLTAGTWIIIARARFSANANGYRSINISPTSGDNGVHMQVPAVSGAVTQLALTRIVSPTATTNYYLNAYQNSGSSLTMPAGSGGEINGLTAIRIV